MSTTSQTELRTIIILLPENLPLKTFELSSFGHKKNQTQKKLLNIFRHILNVFKTITLRNT